MRKGRVFISTEQSNIIYIYKNIKFYLSSDFNLERMRKMNLYIKEEIQKIRNRYCQEKMPEDLVENLENYIALYYYKKIEKRGIKYEIIE